MQHLSGYVRIGSLATNHTRPLPLRCPADLLSTLRHLLEIESHRHFMITLNEILPKFLVHGFVVIAAIKAVKDVTPDGTIKNIESGFLKDAWRNVSQLELECVIFGAIYKQDYANEAEDTKLFK